MGATSSFFVGLTLGATGVGAVESSLGRVGRSLEKVNRLGRSLSFGRAAIEDAQRLTGMMAAMEVRGETASRSYVRMARRLGDLSVKLRRAGIDTSALAAEQHRLTRAMEGVAQKQRGLSQLGRAWDTKGLAAAWAAGVVVPPVRRDADRQAAVRDIAIKAGIAGTADEEAMERGIGRIGHDTGIGREEAAGLVDGLVTAGMEWRRALELAGPGAKFALGQRSTASDTASAIAALRDVAGIEGADKILQALETMTAQGKEGKFETRDMARWFPELLGLMQSGGTVGTDAVTQLGAMLQVQRKLTGPGSAGSDQAANNLKNWFSKIGSSEVKERYQKVGIDYESEMDELLRRGMSGMEASFELAREFLLSADPSAAASLASGDKATSAKAAAAFQRNMLTGEIFSDMQVKSALIAYMQGRDEYWTMKGKEIAPAIEADLARVRETTRQGLSEVAHGWGDFMGSVGKSLRRMTTGVSGVLAGGLHGASQAAERHPMVTAGLTGATAAFGTGGAVMLGRGLYNVMRGRALLSGSGLGKVLDVFGGKATAGPATFAGAPATAAAGSGAAFGGLRRLGTVFGGLRGVAVFGALTSGMTAWQASREHDAGNRAAGYGAAFGSFGGGLAAAKLGAMMGSAIAPGIGTALGAIFGGALGAGAGDKIGAMFGRAIGGGSSGDSICNSGSSSADSAGSRRVAYTVPGTPPEMTVHVTQHFTLPPDLSDEGRERIARVGDDAARSLRSALRRVLEDDQRMAYS